MVVTEKLWGQDLNMRSDGLLSQCLTLCCPLVDILPISMPTKIMHGSMWAVTIIGNGGIFVCQGSINKPSLYSHLKFSISK